MRAKIVPPLLRDRFLLVAVAIVALFLGLQATEFNVLWTELGSPNLVVLPLLVLGITVLELNRRATVGRERRFWSLLMMAQTAWLLAELVYWLPGAEASGAAVELANDSLLTCCYVADILALQTSPHLSNDGPRSSHTAIGWQISGTVLFAGTMLVYFSLIPIVFNPTLYITLVPSMVMFVVLDLYLVMMLAVLLRQTRSVRWMAIYGALIVANMLWVIADSGEGLVYFGTIESTSPWASLVSSVAMLAVIAAARIGRSPADRRIGSSSGTQRPPEWNVNLVVFACFIPAMHVGVSLSGLQDEATRVPREFTALVALVLLGALAFFHHLILEKSARNLKRKYEATQKRLVEEQLEAVRLRERARAEKVIQHTQRLESLGILAGGIAHDFNNLLMGIAGNGELALRQHNVEPAVKAHIEAIMSASEQATALTDQMLAYAGRGRFDIQRIDLNQIVRDIVVLLQSSIHKGAELKLALDPGVPSISADRAQIQQVVMNLVTNASDAIGKQVGTITVRTGYVPVETRPTIFVEVNDTGCGMDEETKKRMFDPFFSTKATGRGLGLAAVNGIVRSHGGILSVESSIGLGSTIRVVLPAIDKVQRPSEALQYGEVESARSSKEPATGSKVLIIDDEEMIRKITCTALESAGWQVTGAADGETALKLFRETSDIEVVVLDLTMPGKSGTEVLEEMRRLRPNIPAVLMSGYAETDVEEFLDGTKAVRFLKKPFRPRDLLDDLQDLVSLSRTHSNG